MLMWWEKEYDKINENDEKIGLTQVLKRINKMKLNEKRKNEFPNNNNKYKKRTWKKKKTKKDESDNLTSEPEAEEFNKYLFIKIY